MPLTNLGAALDANDVPAVRAILKALPRLKNQFDGRVELGAPRVQQMQTILTPEQFAKVCDLITSQNEWETDIRKL